MYKVPVDVIKIANANDIKVYEGDLDKKTSGAIRYKKEEDKFEILVNKNDAKTRRLRKTNCPYLCRNCVPAVNETAACSNAGGCL